jgi:hypothetical protein
MRPQERNTTILQSANAERRSIPAHLSVTIETLKPMPRQLVYVNMVGSVAPPIILYPDMYGL